LKTNILILKTTRDLI